nr:hypothetical protein [Nocardia asiatica]
MLLDVNGGHQVPLELGVRPSTQKGENFLRPDNLLPVSAPYSVHVEEGGDVLEFAMVGVLGERHDQSRAGFDRIDTGVRLRSSFGHAGPFKR